MSSKSNNGRTWEQHTIFMFKSQKRKKALLLTEHILVLKMSQDIKAHISMFLKTCSYVFHQEQ